MSEGPMTRARENRLLLWLLRGTSLIIVAVFIAAAGSVWYLERLFNHAFSPNGEVTRWLDRKASGYYIAVAQQVFLNSKVMQLIEKRRAEAASAGGDLQLSIDLAISNLTVISPNAQISEQIKEQPSYKGAYDAANMFLHSASKFAKRDDSVTFSQLEAQYSDAEDQLRELEGEAMLDEANIRDGLINAVELTRNKLAGPVLSYFRIVVLAGLLLVPLLYWSERGRIKAKESRFRKLEELLAVIGHDLRSPLQSIMGLAGLMEGAKTPGERAYYANAIKDSSERLRRLVDDLEDLGRLQNDQLGMIVQPFALQSWIESLIISVEPLALNKGLDIRFKVGDLPAYVLHDRQRLGQMIYNLLGNAVKFTQTGKVELTVTWLSRSEESGVLELSVSDTGPGIAKEDLKRIFDPFTQVGTASSRRQGMGLGLAIVKRLVEASNGTVKVVSTIGKGTTFTLRIPMEITTEVPVDRSATGLRETPTLTPLEAIEREYGSAEQRNTHPAETRHSTDPTPVVLFVDDDKEIQFVIARMLREIGFECDVAFNGVEALELARQRTYVAIITDLQMPRMDGRELARTLIQENISSAPIIAVTAHTNAVTDTELHQLFDRILYKPLTTLDLLDALEELVDS